MSMLYVLIPLALMLLAVAVWGLIWAIRSGQFDDLESHAWSVVLDDDQKPPPEHGPSADSRPDPNGDAGGRIAAEISPDSGSRPDKGGKAPYNNDGNRSP